MKRAGSIAADRATAPTTAAAAVRSAPQGPNAAGAATLAQAAPPRPSAAHGGP
jgi:hypothetical protein